MTESVKDSVSANAAALLIHYSFDLNGCTVDELVTSWSSTYQPLWVRSAVIEALYQGRYKAISVEQILALWRRRGQPLYHFNHEFERIVCSKFPQVFVSKAPAVGEAVSLPPPKFPPQSHWRYLLPAAARTDRLPAAPVKGSASPATSLFASAEELSIPFYPMDERSRPENIPSSTAAELTTASNSAPLSPDSNPESLPEPVPESVPVDTSPETITSEVVAEFSPATAPILPQTPRSINTNLVSSESDLAADASLEDVSLESVLAEADRLLAGLPPMDSEPVSTECALANQAKTEPIHQFVPIPESSEFYTKLKAVAQTPEDELAVSETLSPSESNSQRA
uniref:hypothetical protein n=1 Tax=Trichocoleus desertorum TaxID=1481672 RepID=UPI0025B3DEB7